MPFSIDARPIACTASIGIALGESSTDSELLLRQAEVAMYAAKDAGRDREAVFEPQMLEG
jgi:PleD family two-component response regulator